MKRREQKKKRSKLDLDKVEKIVRTIKVENGGSGAASKKRQLELEEEPLIKIKKEAADDDEDHRKDVVAQVRRSSRFTSSYDTDGL